MRQVPPEVRTRVYGIATAAMPILVAAGVLTGDDAGRWLILIAALLGIVPTSLATAYRPTKQQASNDTEPLPEVAP